MRLARVLAAVLCLVATAPAATLAGETRNDVAAAYAAWSAAFDRHDATALAALYLPDAKLVPAGEGLVSGAAEIGRFFAGIMANGVTDYRLDLIDAGGDDRIVYAVASWTATSKGASAPPRELGGIATEVFERQPDGSLRLRLHAFNQGGS
jgi:ketosteroid isomerase-like protein